MIKHIFLTGSLVCLGALLGSAEPVSAQTSEGPFQKLAEIFQPRKKPAAAQPSVVNEDANRLSEILVELAWLGDPVTFPFYLEAHLRSGKLEVRGNVPSARVREHALKVARLYCPLPVVDALKENRQLTVRPLRMAPGQLQNSAQVALRESLPGPAKSFQIKTAADGRIAISGSVQTFEEKLRASQALRRLHGCTSVANLVQVAADPEGTLAHALTVAAPTPEKTMPASPPTTPKTPPAGEGSSDAAVTVLLPNAAKSSSGTVEALPTSVEKGSNPGTATVTIIDPNRGKNVPRLNQAQLKKRIEEGCRLARDVKVTFTSATEVKVEVRVARPEDGDQLAGQVLSLPELEPYRVDLHIVLPQTTEASSK